MLILCALAGVNIRVKFTPTNQRRDPEATTGMSMKPRVTEQSPVKETGMDLSMANRKRVPASCQHSVSGETSCLPTEEHVYKEWQLFG